MVCCHLCYYVCRFVSVHFRTIICHIRSALSRHRDQSEQSIQLNIMDHLMDIYANVEELSGQKKSLSNCSESVYENVLIDTLEPNRTGPALSGVEGVKKSSCRAAAVVLGLLCLLLLTGLMTSVCLFTKGNSEWETEMVQLQTSYTNLTRERDQLQTSNTNLINALDMLQKRVEELVKKIRGFEYSSGFRNSLRGRWTS